MAQLPPSPFISNSTVSPRAVDAAATNLCVERSVAAAVIPISHSPDLISEHARSAVASLDLQPRATAEPISKSTLGPATGVDTAAGPEFADPPVPAAVIFSEPPSNEGRPRETPASAPTKNPDVGVLDAIDCIHEIFHYARKLMRGHQGFVLDEAEFLADVEEEPLFIRDGEHLRRWEA